MLLALAVEWEMNFHHVDMGNVYLNSNRSDEIFMKESEYFTDQRNPYK